MINDFHVFDALFFTFSDMLKISSNKIVKWSIKDLTFNPGGR